MSTQMRCIDASSWESELTVGKVYDVTFVTEGIVRFTTDKGLVDTAYASRFEEVTSAPAAQGSALRQDAPNEGVKGDAGKPDLSLLSPTWIFGVASTLSYGAKKRGAHNWRKGIKITRLCAGALRHIFQFIGGEDYDFDPNCPDCQTHKAGGEPCEKHSGQHHLDCASCNLMFARELLTTRPDLDDRYKKENV